MEDAHLTNDTVAAVEPYSGCTSRDRTLSVPPSLCIVDAVADATDRTPTDLEPLQHYVDADALDKLLSPSADTVENVRLRFTYDDVDVVVEGGAEPIVRVLE